MHGHRHQHLDNDADDHVVHLYADLLQQVHKQVLDIAVRELRACDHDRDHGHPGCPACRQLAPTVDWLAAYRELQRDAAALLRWAYDLTAWEQLDT